MAKLDGLGQGAPCAAIRRLRLPDGVYVGTVRDNKPHGTGRMLYANGDVYDGEWKNGLRHGAGRMDHANGAVFDGEWENGDPVRPL